MVVTIVVLLILAGITLVYVFGDNSVFKQASNAKLETELAKIEEKAGIIYSDKWLEKVSSNSDDKPTMQEIVEELKNQGDKIEEVAVDGDGIIGISLDRETMTLGFRGTNKIKVTLERSDTLTEYYAVVDGKYYKMHFDGGVVTIERRPSEVSNEGTKKTLKVSNSDDTVATVTLEESTNIITVTATNKAGTTKVKVTYGSYEKECVITVRDIPITTAMELNSVRARIAAGYTRWLTAITTPTDALQEFEWNSSDTNIATVDNKGVITAKKAGTVTITAKTIDGSNKEGTCEVTVVENAVDVATLTEIQTGKKNIIAKDRNGNLITVPIGFKVLTSEGTKVTDGIVIQDELGNEFVWVPIDSVAASLDEPAEDVRLGRYWFDSSNRVPLPGAKLQDAADFKLPVRCSDQDGFIEYVEKQPDGGSPAKSLPDFVAGSFSNGGYFIGRYEASKSVESSTAPHVSCSPEKSQWVQVSQVDASSYCQAMYPDDGFFVSDLLNSYSWDTALLFIQKFSGDFDYALKRPQVTPQTTGSAGDVVCNINDMGAAVYEWTTEYGLGRAGDIYSGCKRGAREGLDLVRTRSGYVPFRGYSAVGFRPILYIQ